MRNVAHSSFARRKRLRKTQWSAVFRISVVFEITCDKTDVIFSAKVVKFDFIILTINNIHNNIITILQ